MGLTSKAEIKIAGDEYAGFYSCGLTMLGNSSMRRFTQTEERIGESIKPEDESIRNPNGDKSDPCEMDGDGYCTVTMTSDDGLCLRAVTSKSPYSDAYEVRTCFTNGSKENVTLEMMTSFLLPGIKADKLYRIQSFWSAE